MLPTTCRRFAPRYLFVLATRSSSIEVEPIHDTWIAEWTTRLALSLLRMQIYEARVPRLHLRFIYISPRISYMRHCNLGPELTVKDFIKDHQLFLSFLFFVSFDFEREFWTCETHSFFVQIILLWSDLIHSSSQGFRAPVLRRRYGQSESSFHPKVRNLCFFFPLVSGIDFLKDGMCVFVMMMSVCSVDFCGFGAEIWCCFMIDRQRGASAEGSGQCEGYG